MPYSGIEPGSELEKKIERCSEDVMAQHAGDPDFTLSNAIAICRAAIEGKNSTQGGLNLEPVTHEDLVRWGNVLHGSNLDEVLKFTGAVLCRAEVNTNNDGITRQGVYEIASSIPLKAIDEEHRQEAVVGTFFNGYVSDDGMAALTDGIIYARRFQKVAQGLRDGTKKLSVEAVAEKAVCSVCQGVYSSPRDYCDHLRHGGAVRWLYGLTATGGAVTDNPAGTDTVFDTQNGLVMIASQMQFEQEPWLDLKDASDRQFLRDLNQLLMKQGLQITRRR